MTAPGDVTQILLALRRGDADAHDRLMPLVYAELRRIAARHLRGEAASISVQPTDLVHEAYLRLIQIDRVEWQDRVHFFAIASRHIRRILVDHARASGAKKRGAGVIASSFPPEMLPEPARSPDLIALDEALARLAALDERQARTVEMRFFGGMTEEEIGSELGVSARTVKRDWRLARAWLYREIALP